MSVIRRQAAASRLTPAQAGRAIDAVLDLPLTVYPTASLLRRVWALRANVTAYDGCYIALAEALDCPLLTADIRLTKAPGITCVIETL